MFVNCSGISTLLLDGTKLVYNTMAPSGQNILLVSLSLLSILSIKSRISRPLNLGLQVKGQLGFLGKTPKFASAPSG